MDTQKFGVTIKVDPFAPDEYKQHARDQAHRDVALRLWNELQKVTLPATVDIEEEILQYPKPTDQKTIQYFDFPQEEIRIQFTITPVEHRQVVMQHWSPAYEAWYDKPSLWQRIKRRFGKRRNPFIPLTPP